MRTTSLTLLPHLGAPINPVHQAAAKAQPPLSIPAASELTPQHHACPDSSRAQVCQAPQVMERKVWPPATSTGVAEMFAVISSLPSWDSSL